MSKPDSKMILTSNVFSRFMFFKKAGDVEMGHKHHYDHATLISTGRVQYEVLDSQTGLVTSGKEFAAPAFVFVAKETTHRITALEDNTVCVCIHALRDEDGELLDPDFLIDEVCADGKPVNEGLTSNRDPSLWTTIKPVCDLEKPWR